MALLCYDEIDHGWRYSTKKGKVVVGDEDNSQADELHHRFAARAMDFAVSAQWRPVNCSIFDVPT
jgi:hypothetical protein